MCRLCDLCNLIMYFPPCYKYRQSLIRNLFFFPADVFLSTASMMENVLSPGTRSSVTVQEQDTRESPVITVSRLQRLQKHEIVCLVL